MEGDAARLMFRLEDTFDRLALAAVDGTDTARWESLWTELLNEYEALRTDEVERRAHDLPDDAAAQDEGGS